MNTHVAISKVNEMGIDKVTRVFLKMFQHVCLCCALWKQASLQIVLTYPGEGIDLSGENNPGRFIAVNGLGQSNEWHYLSFCSFTTGSQFRL